jgi:RND superfamily putative drug exporter
MTISHGSGIDNGATAPVDPWVPDLLFGLSMDYQVFRVSRIREAYRSGRGDSEAVASGLASTGRVITSAAAIMICVVVAFVFGDLRVLRLFGFAMASAILLDATLVRMVLMPSTMQLLGRSNWWFPGRLERSIPNLFSEDESELEVRFQAQPGDSLELFNVPTTKSQDPEIRK